MTTSMSIITMIMMASADEIMTTNMNINNKKKMAIADMTWFMTIFITTKKISAD